MATGSNSDVLARQFLDFVQNTVKYPERGSLTTASIKQYFDDPNLAPILKEISASISDENVVSNREIMQFEEMQKNSRCLSKGTASVKVAQISHNVETSKAEIRELKEKVKQARMKKKNIAKDIQRIKQENSASLNSFSDAKTIKLHSKSQLAECRETLSLSKKTVNENFVKLTKAFSELSELLKSDTNGMYLSKVSLNDIMASEDQYNSEMTQYVKKQFQNASDTITHDEGDTILSETLHNCDLTGEINQNISQHIFSYPKLEKFCISSQAKAESANSTLATLKTLLTDLQNCQPYERSGKLIELLTNCESQVDELQGETDHISSVLTNLIMENTPLQSTNVLSASSQLKLFWQKYYVAKQKYVISLLQAQRSRLDLLWMLLDIEEASHKKTESHLPSLFSTVKKNLEESQTVGENLRKLQLSTGSESACGIIKPCDKIANGAFTLLSFNEAGTDSSDNVIKLISDLTKLSDNLMAVMKETRPDDSFIQQLSSTIDTSKDLIKLEVTDSKPINESFQLFQPEVQAALETLKQDYNTLVQAVQTDLSEKDKKESQPQQSIQN